MTNPTLVSVPQGGTMLDVLAERYRAAFDKVKGGREQWIEGTLELALVILEARKQPELLDHKAFSRWLERNGLQKISEGDRAALINMAKDPIATRKLLEQSKGFSWEWIWRNSPQRTSQRAQASQPRPVSHRTRRERRVPDVMRDDPPRKQLSEMFLTPEQVDPDFKGTPLEFTTKYGHVLLHTKDQIEQTKRQEALMAWIGAVADHAQTARAMLAALANVDPVTLAEWTSKPAKAEKLRVWCNNIESACEAISRQRPASS